LSPTTKGIEGKILIFSFDDLKAGVIVSKLEVLYPF
jgi:hypothetical protein